MIPGFEVIKQKWLLPFLSDGSEQETRWKRVREWKKKKLVERVSSEADSRRPHIISCLGANRTATPRPLLLTLTRGHVLLLKHIRRGRSGYKYIRWSWLNFSDISFWSSATDFYIIVVCPFIFIKLSCTVQWKKLVIEKIRLY